MERTYNGIRIREANVGDAKQLCIWWNDGRVMAHAGFPNGLGTTAERIADQIKNQKVHQTCRHLILFQERPIGEMNYNRIGANVCEIGIKICEPEMQNRGLGKYVLSLFIDGLFHELNFEKIVLDTNRNNRRAQHVYEQLGFRRVRVNVDSWKDQLGNLQSSVDYELTREQFISYVCTPISFANREDG